MWHLPASVTGHQIMNHHLLLACLIYALSSQVPCTATDSMPGWGSGAGLPHYLANQRESGRSLLHAA